MSSKDRQSSRFEEAARELGVYLDEDKLKEALRRMRPALEDGPTQAPEDHSPKDDPTEPTVTAYCS